MASVVGTGFVTYYQYEKKRLETRTTSSKVVSVGKALLGGPWTLVDCSTRKCITQDALKGEYQLFYFGFTHCPDICPNELVRIGQVVDRLSRESSKTPNIDVR